MTDIKVIEETRPRWQIRFEAFVRFCFTLIILVPLVALVIELSIWAPEALREFFAGSEQVLAMVLAAVAIGIYDRFGIAWIKIFYTDVKEHVRSFASPDFKTYFVKLIQLKVHMVPFFFIIFTVPYVYQHLRDQLFPSPVPTNDLELVLRELVETREAIIREIGEMNPSPVGYEVIRRALSDQGYTSSRAELLNLLESQMWRTDFYYARFPVLFAKGELGDQYSPGETDPAGVDFPVGKTYDSDMNSNIINDLIRALVPCTSAESTNPLLQVEGYASAEPFTFNDAVLPEDESNQLNVHLANERGREVVNLLENAIETHNVIGLIDVEKIADYRNLDQMEAYRQFDDRFGTIEELVESSDENFLYTRAAHIKVVRLGECEVN